MEKEARDVSDDIINKLNLRDKYEREKRLVSGAERGGFDSGRLSQSGLYSDGSIQGTLGDARRSGKINEGTNTKNKSINNKNFHAQPAYHGGAKDYDRFDLNYALTGEGAMAHGYGVYLAKNKNVSEVYREFLSSHNINEFEKVPNLFLKLSIFKILK